MGRGVLTFLWKWQRVPLYNLKWSDRDGEPSAFNECLILNSWEHLLKLKPVVCLASIIVQTMLLDSET